MSATPTASNPNPVNEPSFPFRFVHVFYGVSLFVSAVVTFGTSGILPGILIVAAWAYIFVSRSRPRALVKILLIYFLLSFLWVAVQAAHRPLGGSYRSEGKSNLKQLALSLHNYHDTYGVLPPAYIADEQGRPIHSWRVLILPFIEEEDRYLKYKFDEPWDGPNNRKLLNNMPAVFTCPDGLHNQHGRETVTNFVAVVGPRTSWPDSRGRKLSEIKDEILDTILLIECDSGNIPWMEPRDLNYEDALALLTSSEPESTGGFRRKDFFYEYFPGRIVTYADGTVSFLPHGGSRGIWASLLTVDDGGPKIDWSRYGWEANGWDVVPHKKLRLGNCCRFAIFMLLALFPLPWVWLNPRSGRKSLAEILNQ